MELSIIHRVAQLVNSRKVEAATGGKQVQPGKVRRDTVDITGTGSDITTVKERIAALPEREPDRQGKIEKIKMQIELKQYRMSEDMVNQIAERIASSLI